MDYERETTNLEIKHPALKRLLDWLIDHPLIVGIGVTLLSPTPWHNLRQDRHDGWEMIYQWLTIPTVAVTVMLIYRSKLRKRAINQCRK